MSVAVDRTGVAADGGSTAAGGGGAGGVALRRSADWARTARVSSAQPSPKAVMVTASQGTPASSTPTHSTPAAEAASRAKPPTSAGAATWGRA